MLIWTVGLPLQVGCSRTAPAEPGEPPAGPALVASVSRTIKLPPLFVGDRQSLPFEIPVKNETDRPVRFTQIRQSCACVGHAELDAMELGPGKQTTLHLEIDFRNRKGPQRFVTCLKEVGGGEWAYSLEVTLHVRARFTDDGPIHFGMVDPRSEGVRETQFRLHAEKREALPERVVFRSQSEHVQLEVGTPADEEQGDGTAVRRFPLKVRLRAPEHQGLGQGFVVAHFQRGGAKEQVDQSVTWNVRTLYSVSPTQVYFGTVEPSSAKSVERQVLLRRTDGRALNIKAAKTSCLAVRASVERAQDGGAVRLFLVLDPRAMKGPLFGELSVETDHEVQGLVKVPLAALLKPSK